MATPDLYCHEDDYYVLKFKSMNDLNEILYFGPYTVNNRHMILKLWTPSFDFNAELLIEVPLWVKFPKLTV